jgi:hypothetical protein
MVRQKAEVYIDVDLISLAYCFLKQKEVKTHKQYTYADLFQACEDILQEAEKKNQHSQGRFRFINGHLEVYASELAQALKIL